jgi:antitoxin (DNA-binding transcriptional repressor) of toxin-antitoxin stability system
MTITFNIPETGEQYAALIEHVQAGEGVLISQGGVAIARLLPIPVSRQPRIPGQDIGKVAIAPDFNDPLSDDSLR